MKTKENQIFLTFDDGPIPKITSWVLEELAKYNAKASFFCIGKNVKNNPNIYNSILEHGHYTGNHTYSHLLGYNTQTQNYIGDVNKAAQLISSSSFRPPYGKMRRSQRLEILKNYNIVMWHVLSEDYNQSLSGERCFRNVIDNANKGSIIVFHDSVKAWDRLKIALPQVLEYYTVRGYQFESLEKYL